MTETSPMGMLRYFFFLLISFTLSSAFADACYDALGNAQPCMVDNSAPAQSSPDTAASFTSPQQNQPQSQPPQPTGKGVLEDLNNQNVAGASGQCNSACTTNGVCDSACVAACMGCAKDCSTNGKMCTKKGPTLFLCPSDTAEKDKDKDEGGKTPAESKADAAKVAAQSCLDDNSDVISSCTSAQSSADNTCNADKNAGIGGATDLAAAMALAIGSYTGSGIQGACGSMANISEGSNAALAAYRVSCNTTKNNCTSSCSSAKSKVDQCAKQATNSSDVQSAMKEMDDYKRMSGAANSCKALQTKIDQADQAIKNIGSTMQNAANCQQATAANAVTPVQDCTNPTFAATNQVCICQANPRLAGCGMNESSTVGQQGLSGTTDFSGLGNGAGPTDLPMAKDNNLQQFNAQKTASSDVGGKQGAGAPIGSGSVFNGNGQAAGKAGQPDLTKYGGGSGFYNSASSGGGGSGSGRGGNGSSGNANVNNGTYGKDQRPDLRQFLPGGKSDPSRGVAGTTGPDGITGPNTNIWEKVQNRYRNVTPSLL